MALNCCLVTRTDRYLGESFSASAAGRPGVRWLLPDIENPLRRRVLFGTRPAG